MAEINITELVTTTLRNRAPETADNISNNNALLSRLRSRGNVRPADGGRTIVQPLMHSELSNFMWYSGYEILDTTVNAVVDAAEYQWKQASTMVVWSGLEMRIQNAGREQQIDLLDARMMAAEKTMANQISASLYSAGTENGGKILTGLQAAVADAPTTGVYGGIDRGVHTFWRNQTSGDVNVSASVTLLASEMRDMWVECTRGNESPDLIIANQSLFTTFWDSLTDIQRITTSETGVQGFQTMKFVNADVVYDGDAMTAAGMTTAHMYFLNTSYLWFRPHSNTNFTALDQRTPINQDANNVPMVFAGNLTCSQARVQGVIFDS